MSYLEQIERDDGSRPVSAASSTSSFRIPGINTKFLQRRPDTGDLFAGLLPSSANSQLRLHNPQGPGSLEPAQFVDQALRAPVQSSEAFDRRNVVSRGQNPPSRPFTASSYHRSRLMTADGSIGNYVCAILENRGIGREVGIASIDKDTGRYMVCHCTASSILTPTCHRTLCRHSICRYTDLCQNYSPLVHTSA